ncbi:hypothetical protein ACFU6S_39215 [Streptomyces sp. NPDC057456]|uniref:hypothetical protein n=1 Tax=Streptomyces sp. NPDC057456 TaxID=3346139 RepID=UPI0036A5E05C
MTSVAVAGLLKELVVTLVEPQLVAEVGIDVTHDASDWWHHPPHLHHARPSPSPPPTSPA